MITVSNLRACDPILESLILSKSSIDSIDMLFRDFSTRLALLGKQARNKNVDIDTLVNAKLVWLKVYEKYYLRPPKTIKNELWVKSIDKIASIIKGFGNQILEESFENTHTDILKIQNLLVSIYDGSQNKSFFAKTRMIKHLFHLHKKSKVEKLFADAKLIESRLHLEWNELLSYFSVLNQEALDLNQQYINLNQMSLLDYSSKKENIFKKLDEQYWNYQKP